MRKLEKNHSYEPYSHAWSCTACHAPKNHKESKRLDSNIHFEFLFFFFFVTSLTRVGLTITNILDFALSNYMNKYSKRNDPNKGFSLQPASISSEISLCELRNGSLEICKGVV